jgi:hypothetical protein
MAAAAVIAVGAATAALPGTAEARWHGVDGMAAGIIMAAGAGSVCASRPVSRSASVRLSTILWRPVLCLSGRLRPASPLGDQMLGSSGLALDSRLLLDVPSDRFRPPLMREPAALRVSLPASRDR